jgi:hypothetical protein
VPIDGFCGTFSVFCTERDATVVRVESIRQTRIYWPVDKPGSSEGVPGPDEREGSDCVLFVLNKGVYFIASSPRPDKIPVEDRVSPSVGSSPNSVDTVQ